MQTLPARGSDTTSFEGLTLEDYQRNSRYLLRDIHRLIDFIQHGLRNKDAPRGLSSREPRQDDFMDEHGPSIEEFLRKQYIPTLLFSKAVAMHYREPSRKKDPSSWLRIEEDVINWALHEWSAQDDDWQASRWGSRDGKPRNVTLAEYLHHMKADGWDKVRSAIHRMVRERVKTLFFSEDFKPALNPFYRTHLATTNLLLQYEQTRPLRVLTQAVEVGYGSGWTSPLNQYYDERVPGKKRIVTEDVKKALADELRPFAAEFTKIVQDLVSEVVPRLEKQDHLTPVFATGTVDRDSSDYDFPKYTYFSKKHGWKRLEKAIEEAEKRWAEGMPLEMEKIIAAFKAVTAKLTGWLDDEEQLRLFLGILDSILTMERDYKPKKVDAKNDYTFGPNGLRANVESIRLVHMREQGSAFVDLAVTLVAVCWTCCAMDDDLTGWLSVTDFSLRCLSMAGMEEDLKGLDQEGKIKAGYERYVITRHLVPTLYGGAYSIALSRSNAVVSKDPKHSDRAKIEFMIQTFSGQTCYMCGDVHTGLPVDVMDNTLPTSQYVSTYGFDSMQGHTRYAGRDSPDNGYLSKGRVCSYCSRRFVVARCVR